MAEITMMPAPMGRWVMMCSCGATEIRADDGPSWATFTLEKLEGRHYRVVCHACGQATEHWIGQGSTGSISSASS
ncbi:MULTISPECIES: hypothetical protein [Halomonas]|uniref:CENP-V/GFA domain-containing protein n=1 Tax=Halomonas halophila TaxID=29573 RepID=A0ABQ0U914_9GAMM|nr:MULTISPECIES: hypothetical protein [Halomonas]MDR5891090.1 hypothetical protein [Halomonas salina]WJY08416.1 hypothetical protein QWG60_05745 [Halomonas halophila]GEK74218.1 hypothetical protein HHA04nite_27620 [Halomonas halophila]